jgi:hypothetical protein
MGVVISNPTRRWRMAAMARGYKFDLARYFKRSAAG